MGPIKPLTPSQASAQEASTIKEGRIHRMLVAFDIFCNVIFLNGQQDETISSHAARAAEQGKRWGILMARFLNFFQPNHCPIAQAGDIQRAENVENLEEKSGGFQ